LDHGHASSKALLGEHAAAVDGQPGEAMWPWLAWRLEDPSGLSNPITGLNGKDLKSETCF
jgi:hypothetical protein